MKNKNYKELLKQLEEYDELKFNNKIKKKKLEEYCFIAHISE